MSKERGIMWLVRRSIGAWLLMALLPTSADPQILKANSAPEDRLPACAACRMLADEFLRGLEKTQRSKFEGGDAAYEQERGMRYEDSGVRLIEVQESMCVDRKKHSSQCRDLKEEHEPLLEEWYNTLRKQQQQQQQQSQQPSSESLDSFLCVERLKVCCPKGYFGFDCSPCAGGAERPCSGHGTCRGSGTRKGNGTCKCHAGYQGELCSQCSSGFYFNATTSGCEPCDPSCETCREFGPKGCVVCSDGYSHTQEWGCSDVNECLFADENPCKENTFCANYDGGYHCLDCDRTCDGCYADGPENCIKCATGFVLTKGVCTPAKQMNVQQTLTRWAVYFGLVVCTMIISKKSLTLCSLIGLCVAMYIGASEYTTGAWDDFDFRSFLRSFAG